MSVRIICSTAGLQYAAAVGSGPWLSTAYLCTRYIYRPSRAYAEQRRASVGRGKASLKIKMIPTTF